VLLAEDVSFAPGIKSGKDYLLNALPFFKKQGFQSFSEIKPVDLGGITFYREDLTKRVTADVTAHQAYFCAILCGYALNFAITTDEGDATDKVSGKSLRTFWIKGRAAHKSPNAGSGSGSPRGRLD